MARVYLYTEQPISAMGLKTVLKDGPFQLESFSGGLPDFLAALETGKPGVVVLDLEPELISAAVNDIKRVSPQALVVLWVNDISTEAAFQAMGLGVRGILRKSLPVDIQVKCLGKVQEGELWFEKALTDKFLSAKRVALSRREGQLITLLAHGMKNKEIAATLRITEGTVKVYLSRLFDKVGAKDRFELALFGLKNLAAEQMQIIETAGVAPVVAGLRSMVLEKPWAISC
jgi:two-component system nitrate/nitrite response regulator NarL